jgi:amino acid adenylation domain-containing protein/non-ribosomal peptide synthase protein (TIGR01720 family)
LSDLSKIQDIYSLNPMQEGMLFHYIYENDSAVFLEQFAITVAGVLDPVIFERAFNILVGRHDVLRTLFAYKSIKKPRQIVLKEKSVKVCFEDISLLPQSEIAEGIDNRRLKERKNGFDLSNDIAMRFAILKTGKTNYIIIWTFHHIIIDGWCTSILFGELLDMYSRLLKNESIDLPSPPHYSMYIRWLEKQNKQKSLDYWKDYMSGYKECSGIPRTKVSRDVSYTQGIFEFEIDKMKTESVKSFCEQNKFTLNSFIRTVWGILLQKYNNQNDACFGVVVSGRPADLPDANKIVGLFMNTIPSRIKNEADETFISCVRRTNQGIIEAKKHEYLPLIDILKLTEQKQRLIDHVVIFENYPIDWSLFNETNALRNGFSITKFDVASQANYDLDVTFFPQDNIKVTIRFNRNIYSDVIIRNIERHFLHILDQVIADCTVAIKKIKLITDDEIGYFLKEFNGVKRDYPVKKTYYELFEESVSRYSDKIAVVYGNVKISYHDLNEKINRTALCLASKGCATNDIIGILLHRSPPMMEIILAAWKLGCSYIPLDPNYPGKRIEHIISDSQLKAIITSGEISNRFSGEEIIREKTILFEDIEGFSYSRAQTNLENASSPDSIAYIIYTSGSTGLPKGAMIEQQGMINHLCAKIDAAVIDEHTVIAQNSPHYFDISIWQFFSALLKGGTVVIYPDELILDPGLFIQALIRDEISILEVVPSYLRILLNELNGLHKFTRLKTLFVTGEKFPTDLAVGWFAKHPEIRMINAYGPTEASDDILHHVMEEAPEENQIPVGKPLPNLNVYIVDHNNQLCPLGVKGEIWVSGIGVGRGYLNNPEKTNSVFIDDPFIKEKRRCYRTGDTGRISPEGYVEFYGRIDHQVKIRGFRVELGEIENVLLQNPEIKEAVVTDNEGQGGDNFLCAYYVSDVDLSTQKLRAYLVKKLSDYMIPAFFVKMQKLPVTSNGKIDRKSLPEPKPEAETDTFEPAKTENEKILEKVWQDVLGIKKALSIHDNYFFLGGDSIKAIMTVSHLNKYHLKLNIQDLFEFSTIHELSTHLQPLDAIEEQGPVTGNSKLLPNQYWLFENSYTDMNQNNQAVVLASEDEFNEISVKMAFEKIIEHHDVLRNIFVRHENEYVQKTRDPDGNLVDINVFDFKDATDHRMLIETKSNLIQSGINVEQGPLLKLGLFKTKDKDFLLIVIHHLVMDGISWRILLEEFALAYKQVSDDKKIELPLKTASFQKWGEKIHEYSGSDILLSEISYWKKISGTKIHPLPKDHLSSTNIVKDVNVLDFRLSADETSKLLKDAHQSYKTVVNDILLSALGLALVNWSGNKSHALDVEGHGRESIVSDIDVSRTIGCFTSLYPVILDFEEAGDLSCSIKRTKERLREIPNKGIGYGILKYITPKDRKEIQFDLKPEIKFTYVYQIDENLNIPLFKSSDMPAGHPRSIHAESEYHLEIVGMVSDAQLKISIFYNALEYEKSTIVNLMQLYKKYLLEIIEHCVNRKVTELTKSDFSSSRMKDEDVANMYDALDHIFDSQ